MLSQSAPAVVSAVISPARTRLSHSGRRFCIEIAVEYTSANDWSSSRAARMANPSEPTGNAMNVLLIGLDSRKDQDGNDLSWNLLKHLHAGDSDDGGYNTNTLILAHVSADDRVTAFSIPRDDWVKFSGVPGYNHIKIKEAYGLTKQYVEQKLIDKGVSDQKELETRGREAGRAEGRDLGAGGRDSGAPERPEAGGHVPPGG